VPDIVVGIDFGMTVRAKWTLESTHTHIEQCTGVAYSMAPEWAAPKTIQHWPGKLGYETRNKVDTVVAYEQESRLLVQWGFLVDDSREDLDVEELFKLHLDPLYHRETHEFREKEVQNWFVDFMTNLHKAIEDHFDESYARWRGKKVEFLFSVPTTWKNPGMVAGIEELIKKAGFTRHEKHHVRITLTEAEAAAMFVAKETGYQKGDVFLVCDSGGGTTDVNILKVDSISSGRTQLRQLNCVEGDSVGSTLIDFNMEKIIKARLGMIQKELRRSVEDTAKAMLDDRFMAFKCSFGTKVQTPLDLHLPIPGSAPGLNFPQACIRESKVVITRCDAEPTEEQGSS